jgi:hypothetical protein
MNDALWPVSLTPQVKSSLYRGMEEQSTPSGRSSLPIFLPTPEPSTFRYPPRRDGAGSNAGSIPSAPRTMLTPRLNRAVFLVYAGTPHMESRFTRIYPIHSFCRASSPNKQQTSSLLLRCKGTLGFYARDLASTLLSWRR